MQMSEITTKRFRNVASSSHNSLQDKSYYLLVRQKFQDQENIELNAGKLPSFKE